MTFSARVVSCIVLLAFTITTVLPPQLSHAQLVPSAQINLPAPGTMVDVSRAYAPTLIKGLSIDRDNPLQFEFLMDTGDSGLQGEELEAESYKMIKYFMASLAVPEDDMWVNLSPYEKERIIPETFGRTEMGRDLLAQDYILKQLTSTLMYPEGETGKKFWERIYERLYEAGTAAAGIVSASRNDAYEMGTVPASRNDAYEMGTVPASQGTVPFNDVINTFNKVWIVPQTGYFYEHDNTVFIVDAKLKVMLESDYLAQSQSDVGAIHESPLQDNVGARRGVPETPAGYPLPVTGYQDDVKQILRDIIIPVIEDEVNHGENFANLRQIYNAMLLSVWFKKRMKDHILGQTYADRKQVQSISLTEDGAIENIWTQYVDAFKTGVYDIIKEEYDPVAQEIIPRKYFSGGMVSFDADANLASLDTSFAGEFARQWEDGRGYAIGAEIQLGRNPAMMGDIRGFLKTMKGQNNGTLFFFRNSLSTIRLLNSETHPFEFLRMVQSWCERFKGDFEPEVSNQEDAPKGIVYRIFMTDQSEASDGLSLDLNVLSEIIDNINQEIDGDWSLEHNLREINEVYFEKRDKFNNVLKTLRDIQAVLDAIFSDDGEIGFEIIERKSEDFLKIKPESLSYNSGNAFLERRIGSPADSLIQDQVRKKALKYARSFGKISRKILKTPENQKPEKYLFVALRNLLQKIENSGYESDGALWRAMNEGGQGKAIFSFLKFVKDNQFNVYESLNFSKVEEHINLARDLDNFLSSVWATQDEQFIVMDLNGDPRVDIKNIKATWAALPRETFFEKILRWIMLDPAMMSKPLDFDDFDDFILSRKALKIKSVIGFAILMAFFYFAPTDISDSLRSNPYFVYSLMSFFSVFLLSVAVAFPPDRDKDMRNQKWSPGEVKTVKALLRSVSLAINTLIILANQLVSLAEVPSLLPGDPMTKFYLLTYFGSWFISHLFFINSSFKRVADVKNFNSAMMGRKPDGKDAKKIVRDADGTAKKIQKAADGLTPKGASKADQERAKALAEQVAARKAREAMKKNDGSIDTSNAMLGVVAGNLLLKFQEFFNGEFGGVNLRADQAMMQEPLDYFKESPDYKKRIGIRAVVASVLLLGLRLTYVLNGFLPFEWVEFAQNSFRLPLHFILNNALTVSLWVHAISFVTYLLLPNLRYVLTMLALLSVSAVVIDMNKYFLQSYGSNLIFVGMGVALTSFVFISLVNLFVFPKNWMDEIDRSNRAMMADDETPEERPMNKKEMEDEALAYEIQRQLLIQKKIRQGAKQKEAEMLADLELRSRANRKIRTRGEDEETLNNAMMINLLLNMKKYFQDVGGVNLRADQADIRIESSENGFEFPKLDPAMLNGSAGDMVPVIFKIAPMPKSEIIFRLGLAETEDGSGGGPEMAVPQEKAKEPEQVVSL